MGPGVAQELAGTREGPTVWEDHFLPEIVDPQSGEPVPNGEPGELVITSLTKEAMPVIRYRTRDLSCLLPGRSTSMRHLSRVTARTDDMLIVRGVNVFPSQVEELIATCADLAPHYHIEISRPQRLDEMHVRVEARGDSSGLDRPALERMLGERFKAMVGIAANFEVMAVGTLARSSGKASHVADRRPPT
jgi:phenylacetate-CoA ligase